MCRLQGKYISYITYLQHMSETLLGMYVVFPHTVATPAEINRKPALQTIWVGVPRERKMCIGLQVWSLHVYTPYMNSHVK